MKFRSYLKPLANDTYATTVIKNILHLSNHKFSLRTISDVIQNYPIQNAAHYLNIFKSLGIEYNSIRSPLGDLAGLDNLMLVVDDSKVTLIQNIESTTAYVFDPLNGWIKKTLGQITETESSKVIILNAFYEVGIRKLLVTAIVNNRLGTATSLVAVMLMSILLLAPAHLAAAIFAAGLMFSILAVWESKAHLNSVSFCDLSKSTSCAAVLNSRFSRPFGISAAVAASAFYLYGCLLSMLDLPNSAWLLNIMATASLAATIYFVFIQAFIIRTFCTLCLLIGATNILLFTALKGYQLQQINIEGSWSYFFIAALSISMSAFIRWAIDIRIELDSKDAKLKLFNAAYPFGDLLKSSPLIEIPSNAEFQIYYGNPSGEIKIDLFISLSCQKCRASLKDAERIALMSKRVKIAVNILSVDDTEAKDRFQKLAAARVLRGNDAAIALLKKYADIGAFPLVAADKNEGKSLIDFNERNAKTNNIWIAPSLAVNGRLLRKEFSLIDLKFYVCEPED